jgi:hypothetical protein
MSLGKEDKIYLIDTKSHILWSSVKMKATYKHVEFLFRDRAKFKEVSSDQFNKLVRSTNKKMIEIEE